MTETTTLPAQEDTAVRDELATVLCALDSDGYSDSDENAGFCTDCQRKAEALIERGYAPRAVRQVGTRLPSGRVVLDVHPEDFVPMVKGAHLVARQVYVATPFQPITATTEPCDA